MPNASVSFGSYRLSSDASRDEALALAAGATIRPLRSLSVDLQVQSVSSKVLQSDVRFFGKLDFWFAEQMSLFE
jgi:hypothetical protein